MERKKMLLSVIKLLCESGKPMTTDKISTTLGIDQERTSILLETLADRSVVNKRISEEFEDSFYSSNKVTHEFHSSLKPEIEAMEKGQTEASASARDSASQAKAEKSQVGKRTKAINSNKADMAKSKKPKVEANASFASGDDEDPLIKYLNDNQAPESLILYYKKVLEEREKSKKEAHIWKTSFRELTDNLKKRLEQL